MIPASQLSPIGYQFWRRMQPRRQPNTRALRALTLNALDFDFDVHRSSLLQTEVNHPFPVLRTLVASTQRNCLHRHQYLPTCTRTCSCRFQDLRTASFGTLRCNRSFVGQRRTIYDCWNSCESSVSRSKCRGIDSGSLRRRQYSEASNLRSPRQPE